MNKMTNKIARAEIVARMAHRGQIDKSGNDYAEHCRAVAEITANSLNPFSILFEDAVVAAWLHDVVEDTPLSLSDLRELGFSEVSVAAVGLLTVAEGVESHEDNLVRTREAEGLAGVVARVVRRADIKHNADPSRGGHMTPEKLAARAARNFATLDGKE